MSNALRLMWAEPAIPNPPARVWRDWVVVSALIVATLLEQVFRPDMPWRPIGVLEVVVLAVCLMWRRTQPLVMTAIAFGTAIAVDVVALVANVDGAVSPNTMAFLLLLPYALFRWASGRDAVIGIAIAITAGAVGLVRDSTNIGESILGFGILALPAVLGVSVRLFTTSREREVDQVRLREREQLARELHDTVAHHVSAMVIRAQAGRVVASTRPDAALEALEIIEAEGSRTLTEMRMIVSALRERDEIDLVPQVSAADLEGLAGSAVGEPMVTVHLSGDLGSLAPAVVGAIYRIAQESVTNAKRHALHATAVLVDVRVESERAYLCVRDDGEPVGPLRSRDGYGVIGMTERATLLGGSLTAGPADDRGWVVNAMVPLFGVNA